MWSLLLIPLFLYVALAALLFAFQTRLVFPAGAVAPAGALPTGTEGLTAAAPDGVRLEGVHIPPAAPGGSTLILGFAGNAWNAANAAEYLHDLYPEADVVAFHYRGYRPSSGTPSAAALIADAPYVYDAAVARVPAAKIVAVGFSVGTGIAVELAAARRLDGLILVTPFDSLKAVAAGHHSWLPVGGLFRHEIAAARRLRGVDVPVAIVAAGNDRLIPKARTDGLRAAARRLVYDATIAGAGHNDIYGREGFRRAMWDALSAVCAGRPASSGTARLAENTGRSPGPFAPA